MNLLDGKTAVITGSSRGLGFAIAQAFASEGANVILAARNEQTLIKSVNQLRSQGYKAEYFVCDASNAAEIDQLAQKAVDVFGGLDIWVNNAGISAPYGPTLAIAPDYFKKVVDTNILGVYNGSRSAMQRFVAQGHGKLINLLGRGAQGPVAYQAAYASSKTWVKNFTQALAKEYSKSGVEVMAFNPGLVITDMLTQVDVAKGYEEMVLPLNTVIRFWGNYPEIPAKKVLWMASAATDGKNGLSVSFMTPGRMLAGLFKEVWRKVSGKKSGIPPITIHTVE